MAGIMLLLFIAVTLAELLLSAYWVPVYFRRGIPVFRRTLRCTEAESVRVDADALSEKFRNRLLGSLDFRPLGPEEIAFRERVIEMSLFHYSPVMRGHIQRDDRAQAVTVTGRANAFPIVFSAFFASVVLHTPATGALGASMLGGLVLVLGACYATQAFRFNNVSREVERQLAAS